MEYRVFKWHKKFKEGSESIESKLRPSRAPTARIDLKI